MRTILLCIGCLLFLWSLAHAANYEITTPGNNVGIGSLHPGTTLDVSGTLRGYAFIAGTGSAGATLTGDSNGNIGVDSITPGSTLDISGTVRATNFTCGSASAGLSCSGTPSSSFATNACGQVTHC